MVSRRSSRPMSSYLLRIAETRDEWVTLHYELHDLRSGGVQRFASLPALMRFLRRQEVRPNDLAAAPKKRK